MFEELNWLIKDAVQIRLNSDVPTGIALSGGLDSSIIASCMSKLKTEGSLGTHLLSVVNPGSPEDESKHIKTMEDHLAIPVNRFQLNPQKVKVSWTYLGNVQDITMGPYPHFLVFYSSN